MQKLSFQCKNEQFFASSKTILQDSGIGRLYGRPSGEEHGHPKSNQASPHPALRPEQVIPQIDEEIAEKDHFWIETH
jgi:hypothetical protein